MRDKDGDNKPTQENSRGVLAKSGTNKHRCNFSKMVRK